MAGEIQERHDPAEVDFTKINLQEAYAEEAKAGKPEAGDHGRPGPWLADFLHPSGQSCPLPGPNLSTDSFLFFK